MIATVNVRNKSAQEIRGNELKEMFELATIWLEKNAETINNLNVFPVPDGDTGTNMLLTMKSVLAEANLAEEGSVSDVARSMAKGALMGARGNSGVILSQIMKGFADGLSGKDTMGSCELAEALEEAAEAAYAGLSQPREGTMLTVIKDVATAAKNNTAEHEENLVSLMEIIVEEAKSSVERTPQLLEVLREAGVVDAGGQGVYIILEGLLHYLKNEELGDEPGNADSLVIKRQVPVSVNRVLADDEAYGYCTEMIIKGDKLRQEQIRRWVESQGKSAVVVGDESTVKIHVHTFHPGTIIEFALSLGTLHDLKIQNMDDQHEDFLQVPSVQEKHTGTAVIAVAAGEGIEEVFRSLGTSAVIPGGQTMNPSCAEILQSINSLPCDEVIVLPNNKNIIPSAKQAAELTDKTVKVLSTRSILQGLSSMVSFISETSLDENYDEMAKQIERVSSIEITTAVRDTQVNGLQIKESDYIGIVDGDIRVTGDDIHRIVIDSLEMTDARRAEIVSLFYGDQVTESEANKMIEKVRGFYPELNIELLRGSQPHYPYLISVEH